MKIFNILIFVFEIIYSRKKNNYIETSISSDFISLTPKIKIK